jgi:ketosteroid isomerase-like protein
MSKAERVRQYLRAIEGGMQGEALSEFLAEEVVQEEFPNRLVEKGARRTMKELREAATRGMQVITDQRYTVKNLIEYGDEVAAEVEWTGVLQVPLRSLAAGDTMRAVIGVFFTFRGDRIVSQRNYDCFDPF